jgi:hypothetical protein
MCHLNSSRCSKNDISLLLIFLIKFKLKPAKLHEIFAFPSDYNKNQNHNLSDFCTVLYAHVLIYCVLDV